MIVRSLGWQTDLALLRLSGSRVDHRPDVVIVRTPANPTFRWGNFILLPRPPSETEVPRWLERFAEWFPGSAHVAIGVDGTHRKQEELAPLTAVGFSADASTVMAARTVQLPPRPNLAAQVRAFADTRDWQDALELTLAVYPPDGDPASYQTFVTRQQEARGRLVQRGHAMWFGAFLGGVLRSQLGLVDVGNGLARFQSVETHPDYRGRGLAGTLVHYASGYGFGQFNAARLVMVADPDYGAIRVYRSVGFQDTHTQLQAEKH